MALAVAIPFFMAKKGQVALIRHSDTENQHDEDVRYDIDDFLT